VICAGIQSTVQVRSGVSASLLCDVAAAHHKAAKIMVIIAKSMMPVGNFFKASSYR